jgi:hypothetical protein
VSNERQAPVVRHEGDVVLYQTVAEEDRVSRGWESPKLLEQGTASRGGGDERFLVLIC